MTGNANMPISRGLAEWSSRLSLSDVPGEVRHAAKRCIIDTIGVAVAAHALDCPESARVTIETDDGQSITDFLGATTGMPQNPMSDDQLAAKFRKCAGAAGWHKQQCAAALVGLWDLESAGEMTSLIRGDAACVTP